MNSRTSGLSGVNSPARSATLIKRSRLRVSFTSEEELSHDKIEVLDFVSAPSTNCVLT